MLRIMAWKHDRREDVASHRRPAPETVRDAALCVVADRGMISQHTIEQLQSKERSVHYILCVCLRSVKEIRDQVLSHPGRYREVRGPKEKSGDPSPLQVKNVQIERRRYVVCVNQDQAKKDKADREAIVAALEEQLKRGDKSLVGNRGYRDTFAEARRTSRLIGKRSRTKPATMASGCCEQTWTTFRRKFEPKQPAYRADKTCYVHNCTTQGRPPMVVPARFLVTCDRGHLGRLPVVEVRPPWCDRMQWAAADVRVWTLWRDGRCHDRL